MYAGYVITSSYYLHQCRPCHYEIVRAKVGKSRYMYKCCFFLLILHIIACKTCPNEKSIKWQDTRTVKSVQ